MSGDKLTVTEATKEDWLKVDELSRYTMQPNNPMEWAQYSDRLRCALAEQLVINRELVEALRQIAELTKKQQLPITAQVHELAMSALHNRGETK